MATSTDIVETEAASNATGQAIETGNQAVYSLAELSSALRRLVEQSFDHVRVKAEVSRPMRAASGHVYFTLKDESATLDAVCWKSVAGQLETQPEEGLEVIATGKLTTYPGRSKYQLVVQRLEIAGEGALLKQLEERRRRLAAEGLFDQHRKQPLPAMPRVIGIVTSPTGAVIRDILHRLEARFPVQVLVWPVLVQGSDAAAQVSAAIRGFDAIAEDAAIPRPDLVILARGGGSLEDLMAFNDEEVVRAIAGCSLPLISAIGHETDTTLSDYAADLRAPTPTAAAELATPVASELHARLGELESRLVRATSQRLELAETSLNAAGRALADPDMLIHGKAQRLDLAEAGLGRVIGLHLDKYGKHLASLAERLPSPAQQLAEAAGRLDRNADRLEDRINRLLTAHATRLDGASRLLEASSFLSVLKRGFALVRDAEGGVVRQASAVQPEARLVLHFADGTRQVQAEALSGTTAAGSPTETVKENRQDRKIRKQVSEMMPKPDDSQQDLF